MNARSDMIVSGTYEPIAAPRLAAASLIVIPSLDRVRAEASYILTNDETQFQESCDNQTHLSLKYS